MTYRTLEKGDLIYTGDEVFVETRQEWYKVSGYDMIAIANTHVLPVFDGIGQIRRDTDKPVEDDNYYMLVEGDLLQKNDEIRIGTEWVVIIGNAVSTYSEYRDFMPPMRRKL